MKNQDNEKSKVITSADIDNYVKNIQDSFELYKRRKQERIQKQKGGK